MTILDGTCFFPITWFGLYVLAPLPVSSFAWLLLSVSVALLALYTVPPPFFAALMLPFSEILQSSSCSPQASFQDLLSLYELAPADQHIYNININFLRWLQACSFGNKCHVDTETGTGNLQIMFHRLKQALCFWAFHKQGRKTLKHVHRIIRRLKILKPSTVTLLGLVHHMITP